MSSVVAAVREDVPVAPSPALQRLVGESPVMRALKHRLQMVARATGSVLITGPSGTGKELAARIVHDASPRAKGPFVAVDCGSLSEGVLESELFGHERGAFTGAGAERRGLFEAASGGTIFLDEIGNTTPSLQARLLRVLQEREVRRVGGDVTRRVDVRVIAATNADLRRAASEGTFREDLLYRLDVLSLRMPSLAERRSDVAALCEAALEEIGRESGRRLRLAVDALGLLQAHGWPGNVRELRNALERAAAFAEDGVIRPVHLPESIAGRDEPLDVSAAPDRDLALQELVDDFERRLILARLAAHAWNRTRTALALGVTRRTLFTKMQRLKIVEA